jgi:ATP-dependent Clp protease adaptor protein ClpS
MMVKTADKIEEEIRAIFSSDTPWVTIVWDDPVNLQTYVVYVFMELFGYSKARATELMLQVHNEGKAIVSMLLVFMSTGCGRQFNAAISYDSHGRF